MDNRMEGNIDEVRLRRTDSSAINPNAAIRPKIAVTWGKYAPEQDRNEEDRDTHLLNVRADHRFDMILIDRRSTEGNAEVPSLVFLDYCLNDADDGNILYL